MNQLNEHVQSVTDHQGFTKLVINNRYATCEVYLHGGHVTSFIPKGGEDLLWLSKAAVFHPAKAIRGGIPLCWPWFGPHPSDNSKPAHGFARVSQWRVVDSQTNDAGATQVILGLNESEQTLALWPFKFELQYKITVADTLTVSLTTVNTNDCDIQITEALHSYLAVADINQTCVRGLDDVTYVDKVGGSAERVQSGEIVVNAEVDRVYTNSQESCLVVDNALGRTINIRKSGSQDTVIWNPWQDKSQSMGDMTDEGYQTMVCIEAGNVLDNLITIKPGERHYITQTIAGGPN